jgi:hypothetical protein
MKDNVRVGKLDTKELAEVLKKQNDQQFIAIAVEAIKKTGSSLISTTSRFFFFLFILVTFPCFQIA